jgi:hypothetical protein
MSGPKLSRIGDRYEGMGHPGDQTHSGQPAPIVSILNVRRFASGRKRTEGGGASPPDLDLT